MSDIFFQICKIITLVVFPLSMTGLVVWEALVKRTWTKECLLFILLPGYQFLIVLVYYRSNQTHGTREAVTGMILAVLGLLIDFMVGYFVDRIQEKIRVEKELAASKDQHAIERAYYQQTVEELQKLNQTKKSYREQLEELYAMLWQEEDESKIQHALDDSDSQIKNSRLRRYCENAIVNAILSVKIQAAQKKDITCQVECAVPEDIALPPIDLCSLFTNLMDNAIEACEKIEGKERILSIKCGMRGGYLAIKTENSYEGQIKRRNGRIQTSKDDMKNHGYGLRLIEQIAKEHAGSVTIKEDDLFRVTVVLQENNR